MQEEEQERRLFVCVKDRGGKGASCAGRGALALIREMREALAKESISAVELDVRPAGCLDLCKRGPVMIAVAGAGARERKPPKRRQKKGRGAASATVYTLVEQDELRSVLRASLSMPTGRADARSGAGIKLPDMCLPRETCIEPESQVCRRPETQPHTETFAEVPSLES